MKIQNKKMGGVVSGRGVGSGGRVGGGEDQGRCERGSVVSVKIQNTFFFFGGGGGLGWGVRVDVNEELKIL